MHGYYDSFRPAILDKDMVTPFDSGKLPTTSDNIKEGIVTSVLTNFYYLHPV